MAKENVFLASNHGYLAVDFFFVLSGFVIGYAYDDRWDKMTTWGFFKRRLVRLHPMVILGTVIGASLFFFGEYEGFPNIASCEWWKFALCFVMGLLMIPCGHNGIGDGIYQAVSILLVFPFVVLLGAGSRTTDTFSTRLCTFLGELSYPLYITHYPFMYMQMQWVAKHPEAPVWMHIMLNAGVVIISVLTAWALYKAYDVPVRKWLTDKVLRKADNK